MTLQCKIIKIYILTMRTKNYQSGTRHQKKSPKNPGREVESAILPAWNFHRPLAAPNAVRNSWSAKRGIEGDDPRSLCAYLPSAELLALLAFRRAATVHRGARPRFAPSSAKCWPCKLSTLCLKVCERKARDVTCHEIVSYQNILGPCTM